MNRQKSIVSGFALMAGLSAVALGGCAKADAAGENRQKANAALAAQHQTLPDMLAAGSYGVYSKTLLAQPYQIDGAQFTAEGVALFRLAPRGQDWPDEQSVATTSEVQRRIAADHQVPVRIERLIAAGIARPEDFSPGPVVGLGSITTDEKGIPRAPAVLYEEGQLRIYLVDARPNDGWNKSFKFAVENDTK